MAEKKIRKFDFVTQDLVDYAKSKGLNDQYLTNFLFMAQSEGQGRRESLFYTTPERVWQVFHKNVYFKGLTREQGIEKVKKDGLLRNETKMANTFYGGRLGNKEKDDGWKFRGRTFVQLTGRENYERIGKRLGVDLTTDPDILEKDPILARKVALEYILWKDPELKKGMTPRGMHQLIGPATPYEESMERAGEIFEDGKINFYITENNAYAALLKAEQEKTAQEKELLERRTPTPMMPFKAKDWTTNIAVPAYDQNERIKFAQKLQQKEYAPEIPQAQRDWTVNQLMGPEMYSKVSIQTAIERKMKEDEARKEYEVKRQTGQVQ